MGDKIIEIQSQIRNNASSIRNYMDDLSSWEAEINQIDASLSNKTFPLLDPPPIRNPVEEKPRPETQNTLYKRDKNNVKDYYKAWDKFDVESELEKLEDTPQVYKTPKVPARPQSKVVIKGGRSVNSEIDRLKDQGNLEFAAKEFQKAIDKYLECLEKEPPNDIKVVLYSNTAECFLRLKNPESAQKFAENALGLESNHVKSLLRRAKAYKMLKRYSLARKDLEDGLVLDPQNAILKQELQKLTQKTKSLLNDLLHKMQNYPASPSEQLTTIKVIEKNSQRPEEKIPEAQSRKEQTSKAIESIAIEKYPIPKNLVELERNWAMMSDVKKLRVYLEGIPIEIVQGLFSKGNLESDFLMRIVNGFLEGFSELQNVVQEYLRAVIMNKKIAVVTKFLTKKEKEKIQELVALVGNPEEFRVLY